MRHCISELKIDTINLRENRIIFKWKGGIIKKVKIKEIYNTGEAIVVYRLMVATLIWNFFGDPFLNEIEILIIEDESIFPGHVGLNN